MRFSAFKIITAMIFVAGFLLAAPAQAGILRSSNGTPVLTKDGACVLTGWQGGESCEAAKEAAGMRPAPPPCLPPPVKEEPMQHETAVYFDFNSSALTPPARHHLDRVTDKIMRLGRQKKHMSALAIIGYADRLGKADYNQALALKRAEAVRNYVLAKGLSANQVEVRALGKRMPKADCPADLPRAQMIPCLREDRRVEIEFGDGGK